MKPHIIIWLYVTFSVANVVSKIIPLEDLDRFTKPLLIPLLIFYVYRKSIGRTTLKTLLLSAALLFSWFGDISLMYQSSEMYFMLGIGLFLIAQIIYIFTLRKATFQTPQLNIVIALPFLAYGAVLFYLLLPAGDFTVPIVVYGLVILLMTYSAFTRKEKTSVESFRLAFWGSVLFVLSDSILAFNSFKEEIPFAGFLIMSTYCAAQLLLVKGILKHVD